MQKRILTASTLAVLMLGVALLGSAVAQEPVKDPSQIGRRGGPTHPYVPNLGSSPYCATPGTPILDAVQFTEVINIPDSFNITDLNVSIDATHTFLGDLEISIDNGVNTVDLIWDDCGANDDIAATFDDGVGALVCGTPTLGSGETTTNNPAQEFLSVFNGQNVNGNWTLTVNDDAAGDTGVLNEWCIITTPIPVELKAFEVE